MYLKRVEKVSQASHGDHRRLLALLTLIALVLTSPAAAQLELDESCTVSVLNRTTQVAADGTWSLPNVPANMGPVRARATCAENGVTRSGQSEFFLVPANGAVEVPEFFVGDVEAIPQALAVTASPAQLDAVGSTTQLTVTASFADGTSRDVSSAAAGTSFTVSNPAVATVSADGLVSAVASGTVLISAINDGALGLATVRVVLSADSDGDGIPDDVELANNLDPNDPIDGLEDFDTDGLTNSEELNDFGTDMRLADTDGDTIVDGEEVIPGDDGFTTSPLVADTDGDGLRDGLEVDTGSDPTDPTSFNLAAALASIEVSPADFRLTRNILIGEASRQLTVTGTLIDGFPLELTSAARGTNYSSSNLATCSFGATAGEIFAGADGTCTVTVSNSGFSATVFVTVQSFSPTALAFVSIPGHANNVDAAGDFAYVAAGAAGLQVVDVSNRQAPAVVAGADTPGNANDVKVMGDLAYVADGSAGLRIIDVRAPLSPVLLSTLDTPGIAQDVVVQGGLAYVADGSSGLQIIDVSDPAAPAVLGSLDTPGQAKGVDVDQGDSVAVIADGSPGIRVIDVADPANPALVASLDTGDARDVAVSNGFAYVADFSSSFTAVDLQDPAAPVVTGTTPLNLGGRLLDVTLSGGFGFGADVFFVNGIPIVDVRAPATPVARSILNFGGFRDDNGTGVAVDSNFVYLTASRSIIENGTTGDTRLYIGQYLRIDDDAGIAPTVAITSPLPSAQVIEGTSLMIEVDAVDDFAVGAVELLVDGEVAFRDATAPYQFSLSVPVGATSLTLSARAFDQAGNAGISTEVVVLVIPDPLTTVTGRVVDPDGIAVEGADLAAFGQTALSGPDGVFFISDVPTILGNVVVSASARLEGKLFVGKSTPTPPVADAITDVGDVVIRGDAVVGYYDLSLNRGRSEQAPPIVAAGFQAVNVGDLRTADLSQFDILFVQNASNFGYSSIYTSNLGKVFDWIEAGGVLIFHDRRVTGAANVLPGSPGSIFRNFSDASNINIVDNTTRVTDGPGGVLNNSSLDGGNSSSHGFVSASTIPADGNGILSTGNANNLVLFSYGFGAGKVLYSTIPLDFYLRGFGPSGVSSRLRNIYAPNVIAHANDLR